MEEAISAEGTQKGQLPTVFLETPYFLASFFEALLNHILKKYGFDIGMETI